MLRTIRKEFAIKFSTMTWRTKAYSLHAANAPQTPIRRAAQKVLFLLFKVSVHSEPWTNQPSSRKHQVIIPFATYAPWLNNRKFLDVHESISQNTAVDLFRCYELWILAQQMVDKVEGDILEVGVWRGGSGALLANAVASDPKKRVYLADTFAGVVKAGKNDTDYVGGEHADTSESVVRELLASRSISNCEILVGIFPEDTGTQVRGKLCMVHCDVDVYQSAKDIFDWCLPRLSIGSVFVFDDYGFSGCEGVSQLCEELATRDDFLFMYNLNGHAVLVKIR